MKLPKHKYLLTYRYAEIIHDLTIIFVKKYIDYKSRTCDQMEQSARSAKQNIVEGVSEGDTSKKGEIKFLGFAKSSTDELLTDYEDFLRQRNLPIYPKTHPKITSFRQIAYNLSHLSNLSPLGHLIEKPRLPGNPTDDANFLLTLCHQLSFLLHRQIKSAEAKFIEEGGYSENLFLKRLKQLKKLKSPKSLRGFTLMELLIIIALIVLIATAFLVLFNPKKQIEKTWDGKRKQELSQLKEALEDWYNDKNCYPKPSEICYDSPTANNTCHICGNQPTSPSFSPYLSYLPCDPESPKKNYLYQVDNLTCPTWYRIYADLSLSDYRNDEPSTKELGCYVQSCGPAPNYGYDYGVSSPNIDLEKSNQFSYCAISGCNACGSYQQCLAIDISYFCQSTKIIIPAGNCDRQNCPCQP